MGLMHPPSLALQSIPKTLRDPLVEAFNQIIRNFREGRWEPSELNGGKLCEVIYTILRAKIDGKFPSKPTKPNNMVDACKALEAQNKSFGRSVCIQIPRMLVALYEVRNNRGVGHVGGEVDPNHMDAVVVVGMAKWLMAELVRIFHNVDTATATQIVEGLVDRTIPLIWTVEGKSRVLKPSMPMKERTLAVLYAAGGAVPEKELVESVEHSNPAVFRRDILRRAHKEKLIEYDEQTKVIHLSPLGIKYVEEQISLAGC
jgi:hypothetical protein